MGSCYFAIVVFISGLLLRNFCSPATQIYPTTNENGISHNAKISIGLHNAPLYFSFCHANFLARSRLGGISHEVFSAIVGTTFNLTRTERKLMKFTRSVTAVLLALLLLFSSAFGQRHRHRHTYRNVEGRRIHSPVYSRSVPTGATARCRDRSYSFSRNHRGTCSHHGGVAAWLH